MRLGYVNDKIRNGIFRTIQFFYTLIPHNDYTLKSAILLYHKLAKFTYDPIDFTKCGITYEHVRGLLSTKGAIHEQEIIKNCNVIKFLNDPVTGFIIVLLTNDHLSNQIIHNHVLVIEKINNDKYIMYQSFLYNYDICHYLTNYKHEYSKEEILKFFDDLKIVQGKKNFLGRKRWIKKYSLLFSKYFCVDSTNVGKIHPYKRLHLQIVSVKTKDIFICNKIFIFAFLFNLYLFL